MDNKDEGLERLCRAYFDLDDDDREKVIKLGEGLLKSQKVMGGKEKMAFALEFQEENVGILIEG